MKNIYLQSFIIWLIFAIITVFFGAFRELVFVPLTGFEGNLARAFILPVAFIYLIGITYLFLKRTKAGYRKSDMLNIGLIWLIMTIIFEFGFGNLVMGKSLQVLLADYNIFEGKTWSLFLLCLFLSPIIVYKYFLKKT